MLRPRPHLAHEAAVDDVVETFDDPELHFVRLVRQSGYSTLGVWVVPELDADAFLAHLTRLGCVHVRMSTERFFALDVPAETDITPVLDYLSGGQEADHSDWEVGSISGLHGQQLRTVMDPETLPDWVPRA